MSYLPSAKRFTLPVNKPSISVSPNPAVQGFKVLVSPELSKGKLTILGMDGKLVLQKVLLGQREIEINELLNSGTYIIKVESNKGVAITKLIIR